MKNSKASSNPSPSQMGSKHQRRLRVVEELLSSVLTLHENGKHCVEQFLALSVYGGGSMGYYFPDWKLPLPERDHPICICVGPVNDNWFKWAQMVKRAKLSEFERGEAVREMLGAVIALKNKSMLTPDELRMFAENALEWTRWEAKNLAMGALDRSPAYKKLMKEMAAGTNITETFQKILTLQQQTLATVT
jgi:hypothetical protein